MNYNFDQVWDRSHNQSIKWGVLEEKYGRKDLLPLWVADMDFKTSEKITEALAARVSEGIYGYTKLEASYFNAFISWCEKRHQWQVKKDDLLYSPGVVPSLIMTIKALTKEEDFLIIQPPVYGPFKRSIDDHNRKVLNNPLKCDEGHYTFDLDHLETLVEQGGKILILCHPHNPVGRVWTETELRQLSKVVLKHNLIVISDEIHSDLMMSGHTHVPFASIDGMSERTITFMSPSKTFNLAGLQSSVIVISNPILREKVKLAFEGMDMLINNCFGQVAFKAAYNEGEPWLNELLPYLEANMDYVIEYIQEHLHEIKVKKPEGTYLLWLDCRALGMTHDYLKTFMIEKANIAFTEGDFFGREGEGFMRMNVACPRSLLETAMKQLSTAIKRLRL